VLAIVVVVMLVKTRGTEGNDAQGWAWIDVVS